MPKTDHNKHKALKIEISSSSDSNDSEHELSYYMKDKVKLMKEVLKIIKPKKIKSMAPDCMKHLDIMDINSMLLEELIGISNKRLQYIFDGENVDRETSSSDSDDEKTPIGIISLDDISDDDIEVCISKTEKDTRPGHSKTQKQKKSSKIKKEAPSLEKKQKLNESENSEREKLMSVLELLELQARARAIKSQLVLETNKQPSKEVILLQREDDSDPDAVIIESPKNTEIVLSSSESDEDVICPTHVESCNDTNLQQVTVDPLQENIIILDDDDETQSSKDINKLYDMRRQKLLSKVKKIKLKRKGLIRQNTTDIHDGSASVQESNSINQDCISAMPHQNEDINNKSSKVEEIETSTDPSNKTSTDQDIETKLPTTPTSQSQGEFVSHPDKEKSFDSSDEVMVINLDEDEMKGIEND